MVVEVPQRILYTTAFRAMLLDYTDRLSRPAPLSSIPAGTTHIARSHHISETFSGTPCQILCQTTVIGWCGC